MSPVAQLMVFASIATIVVIVALILSKRFLKTEKSQRIAFFVAIILTISIHYSDILFYLITTGELDIGNNHYLPAYPCNIIMWMCLAISLMNKKCRAYQILANFVGTAGSLCILVGYWANINFLNTPDWGDFAVVKGLFSHITNLYCCLFLVVFGCTKFGVYPILKSTIIGELIFLHCGVFTIGVEKARGIDPTNAMYLIEPPFEGLPFINIITMMSVGLLVAFIGAHIYECKTLPEEKRWYTILKEKRTKNGF